MGFEWCKHSYKFYLLVLWIHFQRNGYVLHDFLCKNLVSSILQKVVSFVQLKYGFWKIECHSWSVSCVCQLNNRYASCIIFHISITTFTFVFSYWSHVFLHFFISSHAFCNCPEVLFPELFNIKPQSLGSHFFKTPQNHLLDCCFYWIQLLHFMFISLVPLSPCIYLALFNAFFYFQGLTNV